jgi:hypothetical protein
MKRGEQGLSYGQNFVDALSIFDVLWGAVAGGRAMQECEYSSACGKFDPSDRECTQ